MKKTFVICSFLLGMGSALYAMESSDKQSKSNTLHAGVKRILERGEKIDVNDGYGMINTTALISSAAHGDIETTEYFLKIGTDIDKPDKYGNTALTTALFNHKYDTALYFRKGAKHYTFDVYGNACHRDLILENSIHPNKDWPINLLIALQGECPICLEDIREVGHIYNCGHSVHKACQVEKCPFCGH